MDKQKDPNGWMLTIAAGCIILGVVIVLGMLAGCAPLARVEAVAPDATGVLAVLAVASATLALCLRVYARWLNRRYEAAISEGVRLDLEWVAHRDAGMAAFMDGEWDEQAAWEAAGMGEEWLTYSSY